MKLAQAIAMSDPAKIKAVAAEALVDVEALGYAGCCAELEMTLRSIQYIQPIVLRRHAPALSIITTLLEAGQNGLSLAELRESSLRHAETTRTLIGNREILDSQEHRLYRRVLVAAWQSDLMLDASELGVLGVLRNELGLHFVDHFLTGYHPEFRTHWEADGAFDRELRALEDALIVFRTATAVCVAEESRASIATAIGIPVNAAARARLFEWIDNAVLAEALRLADMAVGGAKTERIARLTARMLPPSAVLQLVPISDLREIAERVECVKYGSKDQLVARLVDHFARGGDLPRPEPEPVAPVVQPKLLSRDKFAVLFEKLSARELVDILDQYDELPRSGVKATRIETLWNSAYAEPTLLCCLQNRQLDDILERCGLRSGGSKSDRVMRLVDYAATLAAPSTGVVHFED